MLVHVEIPEGYTGIEGTMGMDFPGGAGGKEPACQCRRHKSGGG